jgi:hypothetical protein
LGRWLIAAPRSWSLVTRPCALKFGIIVMLLLVSLGPRSLHREARARAGVADAGTHPGRSPCAGEHAPIPDLRMSIRRSGAEPGGRRACFERRQRPGLRPCALHHAAGSPRGRSLRHCWTPISSDETNIPHI